MRPQPDRLSIKRSIHIKTFGCQMNVYDSDRMASLLGAQGYEVEPDLRKADVVLINTCSIRDKSEQKVLTLLGQLRPLKESDPSKILGIAGCVGQRMGRSLLHKVPHLDLVFGPDSIDKVVSLLDEARRSGRRIVDARFEEGPRTYSQPVITDRVKPSEFLTVMKGCDHFCSYCIVPFVRGREKSRPLAEIISDVERLVSKGTKEITFLGQNINTYGKGTPERLSDLIEAADKVEGLERIRYVTSHPRDLGTDLIDQFGRLSKLCPALHLPFQSGSDSILKKMVRLYTREEYLVKVDRLRAHCPDLALSTDVIVGFPGETEKDFEETLEVLRRVRFSMAFLFKYSRRPGTRAFATSDPEVPEPVKEERLKRVQEIVNDHTLKENRAMIGRTTPVLVESVDKKKRYFTGRNPHAKLVHVMNIDERSIGKTLDVNITSASGSNLRGQYVRT